MSSQSVSLLAKRLRDVIEFCKMTPGIPTGLFLTVEEINLLSDEITPEHRLEHSAGRYRGIPVYDITLAAAVALGASECQDEHEGILFKYVPVLSVF